VVKLDALGGCAWSIRPGDFETQQEAQDVIVDSSDNIIVLGNFRGTIDFGGEPMTSAGELDIFVAKLDAAGVRLWSRRYGDALWQGGSTVATDSVGNVFVAGPFEGAMNFGGGDLVSSGGYDIFVLKLDPSGNHVWSKRYGDTLDQSAGVAVDADGNVYLAGNFRGALDFGAGVLLTESGDGNPDMFVAKLDATGKALWGQQFGGPGTQRAGHLAVDPSGRVAVIGTFEHVLEGTSLVAPPGEVHSFVANLHP
jgi:hypothetical protein